MPSRKVFSRIVWKQFWAKAAFLVTAVSELRLNSALYRQNLAILPACWNLPLNYPGGKPTIYLALSPPMDQRLVLKIILSLFKTPKRKLKKNIVIKNCFVVLRFSEISSQTELGKSTWDEDAKMIREFSSATIDLSTRHSDWTYPWFFTVWIINKSTLFNKAMIGSENFFRP